MGYARKLVTAVQMKDLVANPQLIVPACPTGYYQIPYRAVAHKAAGAGYVVGSNTIYFGYYVAGIPTLIGNVATNGGKTGLLWLETRPSGFLGVGTFLDSDLETSAVCNGPSFSWTGSANWQSPILANWLAASATISYTDTDVTAGKVVTVNGQLYTFVGAVVSNYDVKVDGTADGSWTNLKDAIQYTQAAGVGNNQAGGKYRSPSAHATVAASIVTTGTGGTVYLTSRALSTGYAAANAYTLTSDEPTATVVNFATLNTGRGFSYETLPIYVWATPANLTTGLGDVMFTAYTHVIPIGG
jgi:hypothetical protein